MLNRQELNELVRAALETGEQELGCEECLDQVDRFVEMKLAGLDAAAAMPLVQNHLQKCGDCREEFEALIIAIRTIEDRDSGITFASMLASIRRLFRGRQNGS